MRRVSRVVVLAVVGAAHVATTGCSKLRERMSDMLGSNAKDHADSGAADAGSVASTLEALLAPTPPPSASAPPARLPTTGMAIPDDFPATVPPYPNSKVTAVVTNDKDGVKGHSLVLQTTDSPEAVAAFYANAMKPAKQTIDMSAGKSRILSYHDAASKLDVALTITPDRGHTTVSIVAAPTR